MVDTLLLLIVVGVLIVAIVVDLGTVDHLGNGANSRRSRRQRHRQA